MFAFLAPAALKLLFGRAVANARSDISKIPPKGWLIIAIVATTIAAVFVHQHHVRAAIAAAETRGYNRAIADVKVQQAKLDARARARKVQIDTGAVTITKKAEVHHEQAVADIARDARDLRLRRPPGAEPVRVTGRALPGFSDAAGGSDGTAARALPQLAQVPWLELVDHGELCDVDRAKLETLQGWLRDQAKLQAGKP